VYHCIFSILIKNPFAVIYCIRLKSTMFDLCWSPRREVVQPEGLRCREGGTLPWVVWVEGNEKLLVGIVARLMELQKYQVL
jgi:hypothetical protein